MDDQTGIRYPSLMKRFSLLAVALLECFAVSVEAGETYVPAPPPQPEVFGSGFYLGLDMGANLHQDRGGDQTFSNEFGDTLVVSPKDDVGFFGGIKFGYVFGLGTCRPTVEGDFFYNGFRGGADTTLTVDGVVVRDTSTTTTINSGVFMGNFLLRFGTGRFQPYFGGGIGIYFAEGAGVDFSSPRGTFSGSGGESHSDLAWQIIAGADYYWNPKFSTFIEYRYLDYTSTQIDTNDDRDLGQHLLGAGLRFHF